MCRVRLPGDNPFILSAFEIPSQRWENTDSHIFLSLSQTLFFPPHCSYLFLFSLPSLSLSFSLFSLSISLPPLSLPSLSLCSVALSYIVLSLLYTPIYLYTHAQFFLSIYPSHKHSHIVYVFSFFVSYSLCL